MASLRRFIFRLHNLFRPGRAERELARGLASHLAVLEDELQRRGMTPEEARLAAGRASGGVEQAKELHRDARSFIWLEATRRDVKHATRGLVRHPAFASAAVTTLAREETAVAAADIQHALQVGRETVEQGGFAFRAMRDRVCVRQILERVIG